MSYAKDPMRTMEYFIADLAKMRNRLEIRHPKLWEVPFPEMTYEERHRLREDLMHVRVIANLLEKAMEDFKAAPVPWYVKLIARITK